MIKAQTQNPAAQYLDSDYYSPSQKNKASTKLIVTSFILLFKD